MPFAYGQRTGVTTFVKLAQLVCSLVTTYSSTLTQWANNNITSPTDRATVISWINNAVTVCAIVKPLSTY